MDESRTGKTLSCEAYELKHPLGSSGGSAVLVLIVYWQSTLESGNRELFSGLLDGQQYRVNRGTLSEIRERVYRLLRVCQVEMLIIDEANRLRPKALAEL